MTNLRDKDIQTSPTFLPLPKFDAIYFKGLLDDKTKHYEAKKDGQKCTILAETTIRRDEKELWESCKDMFDTSMKDAACLVRGSFRFDLLDFDAHREINTFNYVELVQLVINHAHKLEVGKQTLIKYSSCFGLLTKLAVEDWGKIIFKTSVEVFYKQPEQFDLLVKKLIKLSLGRDGKRIVVINDFSQTPLLDYDNAEQKERLENNFRKQLAGVDTVPEVYYIDKDSTVELVEKFYNK